jgi:hypothetical protein
MSITEILNEINLLPPKEKICLIQQALKSLQDTTAKNELTLAADAMKEEYRTNKDLTAFSDIDFENFYEAR